MSARRHVLVVDDDPTVGEVVSRYLVRDGFEVTVACDGPSALAAVRKRLPDLAVLDLLLPGIDGLEVFRRLRAGPPYDAVPVVMLTALGDEADRLVGLELGADDYVTKPFSPRELVLRVRSVLRRGPVTQPAAGAVLRDGDLTVDVPAHEVRLGEAVLALTVREYDLLVFLLQHPREAFSREELLRRVWGWEYADHSTVTVHVRRLREKLERDPRTPTRIVTVFGVGVRYELAT